MFYLLVFLKLQHSYAMIFLPKQTGGLYLWVIGRTGQDKKGIFCAGLTRLHQSTPYSIGQKS